MCMIIWKFDENNNPPYTSSFSPFKYYLFWNVTPAFHKLFFSFTRRKIITKHIIHNGTFEQENVSPWYWPATVWVTFTSSNWLSLRSGISLYLSVMLGYSWNYLSKKRINKSRRINSTSFSFPMFNSTTRLSKKRNAETVQFQKF